MELTGEHRIPARRETVWEGLNDPDILRDSIPGCKSLEKIGDDQLTATVAVKVGPVKANMTGNVTLSNIDAPNGYTITGEGKGAAAGFARGSADVTLEEDGDETILRYAAQAQVGGKLAQLGARLIDATAKELAEKFFTAFCDRVAETPVDRAEHAVEHALEDAEHSVEETFHRAEHAVEEAGHRVVEEVQHAEQAVEGAAARNAFGGPAMWALVVLAIVVLALLVTRI